MASGPQIIALHVENQVRQRMYMEAANSLVKEQTMLRAKTANPDEDEVDANTLLIKLFKMVTACELYITHCKKILEPALGVGSSSASAGGSASKGGDSYDAVAEIQRMVKQPLGKMKVALLLAEDVCAALQRHGDEPDVPPLDMRDIQLRLKMARAEFSEFTMGDLCAAGAAFNSLSRDTDAQECNRISKSDQTKLVNRALICAILAKAGPDRGVRRRRARFSPHMRIRSLPHPQPALLLPLPPRSA
jgi:hypothetical protein